MKIIKQSVLERFNYEQFIILDFNYQVIYFFSKNVIRTLNFVFEKSVSSLMSLEWAEVPMD